MPQNDNSNVVEVLEKPAVGIIRTEPSFSSPSVSSTNSNPDENFDSLASTPSLGSAYSTGSTSGASNDVAMTPDVRSTNQLSSLNQIIPSEHSLGRELNAPSVSHASSVIGGSDGLETRHGAQLVSDHRCR